LGTVDPLLSGITTPAAQMIAPPDSASGYTGYEVNPACNFYFMFASTFLVTIVGTWVSLWIVEPKLGDYDKSKGDDEWLSAPNLQPVTPLEIKGITAVALSIALMTVVLLYLCVPPNWQVPDSLRQLPWFGALGVGVTEKAKTAAFLEGIVAIIFVTFLIPGIVYGWVLGTIRSDKDVIKSMTKSMTSMGSYIVLVFFAAQFVKFFEWTNLGTIVAVNGAQAIKSLNLDNAGVFAVFILICALVNLLMGSASAKWTFMAPVFVPMLMLIGYSPEVIQCAYRIGDSCTNVISPMMTYFGMIFVLLGRYDKQAGMGTIISVMLPYSVTFLLFWTAFFYVWVFLIGLPVGPGAPTYFVR
jgi:aminobenzoyl-glutamate transport protein